MISGEWQKLQDAVQRLLPDFYKLSATLRKHLTDQEYMLLLLTRCQFCHYEIRTLMNTSAQRFTNLRTSVNRKLFDEQGARTLTQHIMDMPESLKVQDKVESDSSGRPQDESRKSPSSCSVSCFLRKV